MPAESKKPRKTMDIGCFLLDVTEGSESSLSKLPHNFQFKALCQLFMPLPSFWAESLHAGCMPQATSFLLFSFFLISAKTIQLFLN